MVENILGLCLGIGLAASSGFRVFVPLLAANLADRFGMHMFSGGFEWMGSTTALVIFATATVFEIAAYYIPFVDNALDTIATPLAVGSGTLLATSYLGTDISPALKWGLGLIMGGGTAGIVQAGTGLLRLGSTTSTAGLANPAVSTAENGLSVTFSVLAILIPTIFIVVVVGMLIWIVTRMVKFFSRRKKEKDSVDDMIA